MHKYQETSSSSTRDDAVALEQARRELLEAHEDAVMKLLQSSAGVRNAQSQEAKSKQLDELYKLHDQQLRDIDAQLSQARIADEAMEAEVRAHKASEAERMASQHVRVQAPLGNAATARIFGSPIISDNLWGQGPATMGPNGISFVPQGDLMDWGVAPPSTTQASVKVTELPHPSETTTAAPQMSDAPVTVDGQFREAL